MKKALIILLALVMILSLSACGEKNNDDTAADGNRFVMLRGRLAEDTLAELMYNDYGESDELKVAANDQYIYVDTLNEALMNLKSDKADYYCCLMPVAQYLAARDDSLAIEEDMPGGLNLFFRAEDAALRDEFDTAIARMQDDGTIDRLYAEQVTALLESGEPADVAEMPVFEGADSITVGVSGDMPPIDYVDSDGEPAGFNLALLAELAKMMEINIEVITIDGGMRFEALSSGRVDIFFWEDVYDNEAEDEPVGEDFAVSAPYLKLDGALVYVKQQ